MRPRHKKISRPKVLAAAGVAVAAAIALPQANASSTESPATGATATETLRRHASIPGTAWATDPDTGQVVVTADSTVTGDKWNTLMSAVRSVDKVRVERSSGQLTLFAEGGDAIFAGRGRCSLGFNVTTSNGNPGFLTAGHCAAAGRQWSLSRNARPAATVQRATFPGTGDFALLTYNNSATQAPSLVDVGNGRQVQIRQAANARVGQRVFRMGATTGLRNGRVTGLNATVNYREGTVTGLIQTSVCAEPGDSGGPLFTQDGSAIGLTSGGGGNCRTGGVTFFQPVTEALAAAGAEINGN